MNMLSGKATKSSPELLGKQTNAISTSITTQAENLDLPKLSNSLTKLSQSQGAEDLVSLVGEGLAANFFTSGAHTNYNALVVDNAGRSAIQWLSDWLNLQTRCMSPSPPTPPPVGPGATGADTAATTPAATPRPSANAHPGEKGHVRLPLPSRQGPVPPRPPPGRAEQRCDLTESPAAQPSRAVFAGRCSRGGAAMITPIRGVLAAAAAVLVPLGAFAVTEADSFRTAAASPVTTDRITRPGGARPEIDELIAELTVVDKLPKVPGYERDCTKGKAPLTELNAEWCRSEGGGVDAGR